MKTPTQTSSNSRRYFSKLGLAALVAIVTLSSFSCSGFASSSPSTPVKETKKAAVSANPKLVDATTKFGFKLFSEILKKDNDKNVFVSPSSVSIALSMAYNGANGSTQTAMAKALQLQGLSLQDLNKGNADLKSILESADPGVQVAIANSLWAKQGVDFKAEFRDRNDTFYDAKLTALDFNSPNAPTEINNWVKDKTRGKIGQIVDRIAPDQIMFLINATYFKGKWTEKFDRGQTQKRPFFLANGSRTEAPLMKQSGTYRYAETEQFQAVSLPYGDERLSLYVFLPKRSLSEFGKTLTAENWQTWMQAFGTRDGSIQLPRFKMTYDVDLKDALSALGMGIAFDPSKADFSNLSPAAANINQVKHKTFVDVNEEGTEAAAVTSIGVTTTAVPIDPPKPFNMVVNRPFFYSIRDHKTGAILFMGTIVDPNM